MIYGAPPGPLGGYRDDGYPTAGGFAPYQAQRGPPPGADPQYVLFNTFPLVLAGVDLQLHHRLWAWFVAVDADRSGAITPTELGELVSFFDRSTHVDRNGANRKGPDQWRLDP